jgi:hypothetical protein
MVLKAQQPRFPFIVLIAMLVVGTFAGVWVFLRTADFSVYAFAQIFGILVMVFIAIYFVAMDFKKVQSIELDDDGVSSLVWVKPIRPKIWPRLEKIFLKWADVQKIEVRANLIYLYGSHYRVAINTLLFKDANEVVKFINRCTKVKNS